MSWPETKRRARDCERQATDAIASYASWCSESRSAATADPESGVGSAAHEKQLRESAEEALGKLDRAVSALAGTSQPGTQSFAFVQRYREVAASLRSEFRRTAEAERRRRETNELLEGRRGDGMDSATEFLLRERNSLASSHRMTDETLSQAAEARHALQKQTGLLTASGGMLRSMTTRFPAAQHIATYLKDKRRRDNAIVAVVIGLCICLCLWYILP
mmetsp:Transcript_24681/g.79432  ORF Transcript_24681/g.79432 Transcript_24681/m.79432 type:complete len:218 (-) Transcript_24681:38-691(-)